MSEAAPILMLLDSPAEPPPRPSAFAGAEAQGQLAALRPLVRAVVARTLQLSVKHPDVDDAVAETMRRVVEGVHRVRPGEPVSAWATGVARHVALDQQRRARRARAREASEGSTRIEDEMDPGPSPEDRAGSAQRLEALERALSTLPATSRAAIVAFYVEGQSYQAIATQLSVPMGTVATWIARGRKALVVALGPDLVREGDS